MLKIANNGDFALKQTFLPPTPFDLVEDKRKDVVITDGADHLAEIVQDTGSKCLKGSLDFELLPEAKFLQDLQNVRFQIEIPQYLLLLH